MFIYFFIVITFLIWYKSSCLNLIVALVTVTSEDVCRSIRNVKFINGSFYNMRCLVMFITAVCLIFLKESWPRSTWKLTVVEERISNTDGEIRAATFRTASEKLVNSTLIFLYPLQCAERIWNSRPARPKWGWPVWCKPPEHRTELNFPLSAQSGKQLLKPDKP